jgi:tetratricopeptide (TPR) repeat protein
MLPGLNSYIQDIKEKINSDFLSPLFIRLANLYYHDGQYDECITICNIGLKVYPDYTTAKLLLFKAMLKLEYINEAESILRDIESKFPELETIRFFKNELNNIRKDSKQEKIYYSNKINTPADYHSYSAKISDLLRRFPHELNIDKAAEIIGDKVAKENFINEDEFRKFSDDFKNIKSENTSEPSDKANVQTFPIKKNIAPSDSFFSGIKIITESLADILAKQGFFKEAFEAYNILLSQENSNKRRIQEKLYDLERNF